MTRFGLFIAALLLSCGVHAQSVLFINPGYADEAYWAAVSDAMHKAERSLGMKLEVLYANRNHMMALQLMREVVARPAEQWPDYFIITNDYGTGPALLKIIEPTGIPTFFAFSGLPGDGSHDAGTPRERYPFWLGSLEPRAEEGGYLTAKALIAEARKHPEARNPEGQYELIAIAGDRSTPASALRTQGMQRAVAEAGDVIIRQLVYGDWKHDKAKEQAAWLFQRYPHARLIWCGNDLMAFGAMDAWRALGGQPGRDAWFSGINTSVEAMQALRDGTLTALAGGHFMNGAWAMVLLHDHAKGIDFASEGLQMSHSGFILFDARSAKRFSKLFGPNSDQVDFRRFSKAHNPKLERYDFDFSGLLQ